MPRSRDGETLWYVVMRGILCKKWEIIREFLVSGYNGCYWVVNSSGMGWILIAKSPGGG